MAKDKEIKDLEEQDKPIIVEQKPKQEQDKPKTFTECWLKSKANYIIEVRDRGQSKFIQPFGRVKVIKEDLQFINDADAYQVTFIKA